jgi:hypothetical protein
LQAGVFQIDLRHATVRCDGDADPDVDPQPAIDWQIET